MADVTMMPPVEIPVREPAIIDSVETGVDAAVKHVVQTFLEDSHYRSLHQTLSEQWAGMNALSSAMKLMEQYGVHLAPEESERLSHLSEDQQISSLVMRMPQQTNEQFQHFFLQLQLLVSTASRVRKALEDGRPDTLEHALTEAESTGISQYILRMAIVQGGTEVTQMNKQYHAWVKDADLKMGKLIRGQEDAMTAQKKLAEAQNQFAGFQAGHNEKAKAVLMTFCTGCGTAMMAGSFKGWQSHVKQMKYESSIRVEYEERIEFATRRLMDFKAENLTGVRKMMQKKGENNIAELLAEVFKSWVDDSSYEKDIRQNAGRVAELEGKLKNMKQNQADSSKKVLSRMNGDSDGTLINMAFSAFKAFHEDYKKDLEMNVAVRESEGKMAKFLKGKSEATQSLMNSLGAGTDSGAVIMCFKSWMELYKEAKQEAEMAEKLEEASMKHSQFAGNAKKGAKSVMERAKVHMDNMMLLRCIGYWKMDSKMENTLRMYHARIDAKRHQLVGVQNMFRNFANQLESGLRQNEDTGRDLRDTTKVLKKSKSDASVSLPSINQPRRSPAARGGDDEPPAAPPRQAWN